MQAEIRNCQNCKKDFTIEPDDFSFYKKIEVPPPTWCRECRQMRRMSFRNERNLFKRKCDKTNKDIISIFTSDSPYKVYNQNYWYSDDFDPMIYGRNFDFSRSFFDQFGDLMKDVPYQSLGVRNSENCDYNNDMSNSKNCYLCARTHQSKDMLYTHRGNKSRDCVDCMQVIETSEFLYECVECITCNNSIYLYFCENCSASSFLWNCKNCLDCFMCSNLRNKQYCFKNQQLSKDEYHNKISGYHIESFSEKEKAIQEFEDFNKKNIRKYLNIVNSQNSTGDNIVECKNSKMCFGVKYTENVKYLYDIKDYKDSMDAYTGGRNSQLIYECTAAAAAYNCKFCVRVPDSREITYSIAIYDSNNCFGCIGLRNAEYCIFNKQYSKEEYEKLKVKIIEHMKNTGEWGEFFPMELSMFPYNNTVAQEYFPMTKKEVLEKGLNWSEPDIKNYEITMKSEELPDNIKDVGDKIVQDAIGCAHGGACDHGCSTAFRFIPREIEFYRKMNLPVPRLCPNCRYYGRFGKLNPLKLWHRKCQCAGIESENGVYKNLSSNHPHGDKKCDMEFETSYAPDRPEIIYCEKCYQQEVY